MVSGWTPVRVVRWPAQQQDREWCAARAIPALVLVSEGSAGPDPVRTETVLSETADEQTVRDAVDELAWRPSRGPVAPAAAPAGHRLARPARRRSVVGVVAAML
ncbi:hypothetical protein [Serinicoccus kebangsaanensis]|uniref:hypothetical protein n=1 Tax=Serinicoccus kebangsaanensis TaxID=2602069 RepID=UPI00124D71D2|nr:hypothetical protein [Serinicoccus kebangsaanensis]